MRNPEVSAANFADPPSPEFPEREDSPAIWRGAARRGRAPPRSNLVSGLASPAAVFCLADRVAERYGSDFVVDNRGILREPREVSASLIYERLFGAALGRGRGRARFFRTSESEQSR